MYICIHEGGSKVQTTIGIFKTSSSPSKEKKMHMKHKERLLESY